jgi:hypothetical protein
LRRFCILEHAKTHDIVVAKEFAQNDDWEGYWVVITDECGAEIARVPVHADTTADKRKTAPPGK